MIKQNIQLYTCDVSNRNCPVKLVGIYNQATGLITYTLILVMSKPLLKNQFTFLSSLSHITGRKMFSDRLFIPSLIYIVSITILLSVLSTVYT
jgi:hypothetical protein